MKKIHLFWIILLILILSLFTIRLINPREIDDLHPLIPCSNKYLEKSDILWVIPKYKNYSISENKTWCKNILSLNKTLGLHGYTHSYQEFKKINLTKEEINESIEIFKSCFGFYPTMFKPPQLKLNDENRKLIEEFNLTIKELTNQLTHRVYHCDNGTRVKEYGGILPNSFYDWF